MVINSSTVLGWDKPHLNPKYTRNAQTQWHGQNQISSDSFNSVTLLPNVTQWKNLAKMTRNINYFDALLQINKSDSSENLSLLLIPAH